jgi:hypothetical protein
MSFYITLDVFTSPLHLVILAPNGPFFCPINHTNEFLMHLQSKTRSDQLKCRAKAVLISNDPGRVFYTTFCHLKEPEWKWFSHHFWEISPMDWFCNVPAKQPRLFKIKYINDNVKRDKDDGILNVPNEMSTYMHDMIDFMKIRCLAVPLFETWWDPDEVANSIIETSIKKWFIERFICIRRKAYLHEKRREHGIESERVLLGRNMRRKSPLVM